MPDKPITLEDLNLRSHQQEVDDAYKQGRRHGFQEAIDMTHAAIDHLDQIRKDFGSVIPSETVPEEPNPGVYCCGEQLQGSGCNDPKEQPDGRILWGGRLWEVDHKTETDRIVERKPDILS